jgi:hypothetical protein
LFSLIFGISPKGRNVFSDCGGVEKQSEISGRLPRGLDSIAESAFELRSLAAIACRVERLPVRPIAEELHVALMGYSVVDHIGQPAASARAVPVLRQG